MSGLFVSKQVLFGLLMLSHLSAVISYGQTKTPPPPKPPESDAVQESVKVLIEEVRIPVTAQDEHGRFDPTVSINDLMLRENGDLQLLKSVYRIPASVLLLLDTGGEQNLAKDVRLTKSTAQALVSSLQTEDQVAVT
jgi:hypothetical protein